MPETCPRAAALSALYIAMGESLRWWEMTALIHGLGSFISSPSTFLPTQWAPGRASCPEETGCSQLAAPGSASPGLLGLPREWCGQSRQGHPHLFLPVPPVTWRPGHIPLALGPHSCVEHRAAVPRRCRLPAMPPVSQGLSGCSLFLQGFEFCYVSRPAAPGVETEWLQVTAQSHSGGGGAKPRAGDS